MSRADIGWNSFTHGTPSRAASKRESVFPFCSCFRVEVRRLFLFLRLYFSLVALASSGPDLTSRPRPTGAVHDVTSSTCKGDAATFRATPAEPYRSSLPSCYDNAPRFTDFARPRRRAAAPSELPFNFLLTHSGVHTALSAGVPNPLFAASWGGIPGQQGFGLGGVAPPPMQQRARSRLAACSA